MVLLLEIGKVHCSVICQVRLCYINVPIQVPLKGAAIFFVNGGTGYSLLYLAKQSEYSQDLPMIQQMVNSFQVGSSATTATGSVGGGAVQNAANGSPN